MMEKKEKHFNFVQMLLVFGFFLLFCFFFRILRINNVVFVIIGICYIFYLSCKYSVMEVYCRCTHARYYSEIIILIKIFCFWNFALMTEKSYYSDCQKSARLSDALFVIHHLHSLHAFCVLKTHR